MDSETIYRSATHAELAPEVMAGIEAFFGAPVAHLLITAEDISGRIVVIALDEQPPHISHDLARHTVTRLS